MTDPAFLKRPTAEETDEDLLRMQEEWNMNRREKPTVQIHKMKSKKKENVEEAPSTSNTAPPRELTGRFTIDLDEMTSSTSDGITSATQGIIKPIRERWITREEAEEQLKIEEETMKYSKNDGFPEPLILKHYYEGETSTRRKAKAGLSFFATEFDRIRGDLDENLDENAVENEENEKEIDENETTDYKKENMEYLKTLDQEQISDFQKEMLARFDQKTLDFLKNRHKKEENDKGKKVSKFKASRMKKEEKEETKIEKVEEKKEEKEETKIEKVEEKKEEKEPPVVKEMLNELEVLDEFANREDMEKYNRLATDAVQLDLTAKFGRNVVSRQQKQVIRLFDGCKFTLQGYDGSDELREYGRSQIEEIKKLYLEEVEIDGAPSLEFANGVNPILDNCWTLVPARKVMDAVEKRGGKVTEDDVEIVRLALLWTLILLEERKSAFYAFAQPADVYVYLSEILMIGPEVLQDDNIVDCVDRILNGYVFKAAREGKLAIRMDAKVGGLDAFMPFFESLLLRYDQYSMGDVQFARAIIIGAYLNAPIGDSIEYRFAMWKRDVIVRQMTITKEQGNDILEAFKRQAIEQEKTINEKYYENYIPLLGLYYQRLVEKKILRDRNELIWEICHFELRRFVERVGTLPINAQEKGKAEILAGMIRKIIDC